MLFETEDRVDCVLDGTQEESKTEGVSLLLKRHRATGIFLQDPYSELGKRSALIIRVRIYHP